MRIGIEHEFVFADENGRYLDGENASYALFSGIAEQVPVVEGDSVFLDCKSMETYPRRCYVEGFELHDDAGNTVETIPKALEIRTLPHNNIDELIREFRATYAVVMRIARQNGLSPMLVSRHPFKESLQLDDRIGDAERRVRSESRLALAKRAMMTHGLHVNVSVGAFSAAKMDDILEKLNYYVPSLVPWSYSSPFYGGKVFDGLCARNYYRAGTRNMASLEPRKGALVLEFRGFDAPGDAALLHALLSMYCGFILEDRLPGRAAAQDAERLKRSCLYGFGDDEFREEGRRILQASRAALGGGDESLDILEHMLENNDCCSVRIKSSYAKSNRILDAISDRFSY